METFAPTGSMNSVTCPFCGLLCDDLTVEREDAGKLVVTKNGCQKSITFFGRAPQTPSPRVDGRPVELSVAVARAAEILKAARHPLISGLGTEVQGMRAVMSLADRAGAALDHMNSNGFMRNIQVVQNSGWQITTLTEVRNRVDLLVIVGTDIVSLFPRFFERQVWNGESMFGQDTSAREIVYLGGRNIDTSAGVAPDGRKPDVLPCDLDRLPAVMAALRALVSGKKLVATEIGGINVADLEQLAQRLVAAKYSVLTWAAGTLDFPHAELTVQNLTELIKTLNKTTRSSGLPLGGNEGEMNANQVSAWTSGYPVRTSYARSYPEHDPYHFSTDQLLASGEADALLWISSFNPDRLPPRADLPTVVMGHAHMQLEDEPAVFIPIGTPGADHKGVMFRCDNVVSLPLNQLRESRLPSLGQVLTAIEHVL
ncbi:formyltransferase/hydrolase complex Fhc subunit B [mine drainage metagenome]|uniref:Formyltransferase/hydrolase complex Fhc subunit B n=1 Tax=mine drainage metagenome TaxID=410659 RepID=A0A1J5QZU8_9ZZZZ